MAVVQSMAIEVKFCGQVIADPFNPSEFQASEFAPYVEMSGYDHLGSYEIYMTSVVDGGVTYYTLNLSNVSVHYDGGDAFQIALGLDEMLKISVSQKSKIKANGCAIYVYGANYSTQLTIEDGSPLILESSENHALFLSNDNSSSEIFLNGKLEVYNTCSAESQKAAIHFGGSAPSNVIHVVYTGRLKAKGKYCSITSAAPITFDKPAEIPANFEFDFFSEENLYAAVHPEMHMYMTTEWCFINDYDVPVKVAGVQVTFADSWDEYGVESPYITGGTVRYYDQSGTHTIYLEGAQIEIPEDEAIARHYAGIEFFEGDSKIIVGEAFFLENGHISRIKVPGGDGIRIKGNASSIIHHTEITSDDPTYWRYLMIQAKTGINIENLTGMDYSCDITNKLMLNINFSVENPGETAIKVWGNAETVFRYAVEEGTSMNINASGPAIVLGNDNGIGTDAYFEGQGELKIVSDGDGLSVYDATVHFGGLFKASIQSNDGAAINGNKSMSWIRKESAESTIYLKGAKGAITDVYKLVINEDCGEIVQMENKDDAAMEQDGSFWTYMQDGKPYTDWTEMRYVTKLFQIGDYVLDDHNEYYFDSLIPGVAWDSWSNELYLENAKIKATGENIGLKPLISNATIRLIGDNEIEAEAVALQNDNGMMHIWSQDGKGKLTIKSTADKGIYNLNGYSIKINDCTVDVTAEKAALWNEDGDVTLEDATVTLTGNGGGYFGAQIPSTIYAYNSFLTCTGSEIDGNVKPSFWGFNNPCMPPVELLTAGYAIDDFTNYPEVWVYKNATGAKTGETIQFGVSPDNMYYGININGIDVTGTTCGGISPVELKGGKISYDPVERELILDNVEMDAASIFIYPYSKCNKVKLIGENTVNGSYGAAFFQNEKEITIYSENRTGKLTVNGNFDPAIFNMLGELTFKDCIVEGTNEALYGIYGNYLNLTIDHADVSVNGKTGSVVYLGSLTFDPDTYVPETGLVAPENAVFNTLSGCVEVDNVIVVDEPVVFRWVKRYNIYVNLDQMNADNCADFKPTGLTSGKISFDPENNVMTLDNINLTEDLRIGIDDPITIMLVGKNKIKLSVGEVYISKGGIIKSEDGKGELQINSDQKCLSTYGDLTIENCRLIATADNYMSAILLYEGVLTVNDAYLRVEGTPGIAAKDLVLGEGMEITEPYGAMFNKLTGCIELNGEICTDEIIITKPATIATSVPVKVTSVGAAGFSYNKALDFTGLPVSAWISTGMRNGNIMLSRVFKVAAGTGIYLKGKKGEEVTCDVPIIEDDSYYVNMFVGVPAGKKIEEKEPNIVMPDYYQTYFFAKSNATGDPTFYPTTSEGKELGQNKMYMRMPVTVDPNDQAGEKQEETGTVTVSAVGAAGFSCDKALDFTDSEITAWIATGFSGGNILLSRVFTVPAYTGVYLKGKAGETVTAQIPVTTEKPYYRNLFRATGDAPMIIYPDTFDPETGIDMSTLYFAKSASTGAPTFFPTTDPMGKELGANKMYLTLPKALMPETAPARAFGVEFLEDGVLETTGISEFNAEENGEGIMANRSGIYDLQGRRVDASMLKQGVYIQNGRKVMKK